MSALPNYQNLVYSKCVMTTFGTKLRSQRESKGLGLRQLARMAGVIESNLLEVEKDKRSASESVLRRLASVPELGLTYEKLRAWQIMAKATPSELAHLKIELEGIQATHDAAIRKSDGNA
jgi:transcriptional regulator with XRE-family HTH domain